MRPKRTDDKYWTGTRDFNHIQYESDLEDYIIDLENETQQLRKHSVSGSLLKSLHQDLKGFQEMGFLTPDAKSGLGIAIEQVERYMRGDLEARQQ